ncbi:hypothetical protein L3081_21350 [Colwellia sp. MSW7]|uniref:Uncharacterized protein n=1 Tax=Colwellia maritima TaxID=2912588 RepID=A0ABS9X5J1_9GAMM|nr:hypothetical protein [Colwellia maritima]MCI2285474.1 hypothetical protein [Colwellia maritima]
MFSYKRILAAISGSAGVALSSLVLALMLMQKGSAEDYGIFSFMLVAQALFNGISNALLGTPLLIVLINKQKNKAIDSFF